MSIPAGNRKPDGPTNVVIDAPAGYNGCRLQLDGQEVRELTDLHFHAPADGVARVTATVNVLHGFSIVTSAQVRINMQVLPGYKLLSSYDQDTGRTSYWCERI